MNTVRLATQFAPTRWTLVLAARGDTPDARAALSDLCDAYWTPVYRFLMREGRSDDESRELTQEFFARLLSRGGVDSVNPSRGRFRSYLLGALRHFLADVRDRSQAARRGGGISPESLDARAEGNEGEPVDATTSTGPTPETWFDRQWAYAIMDRALTQLEREFHTAGREEQFVLLKPWLVGDTEHLSQASAAAQIGLSEGAVKVAIHRLRRRFRELVRSEVAQTVDAINSVDEELNYLIEVLSQPAV